MTGKKSFSDIAYACYGQKMMYVVNGMMAFSLLSFTIIFFIVFGDVAGPLFYRTTGLEVIKSRVFTQSISAALMLYFCLKKEIKELKHVGLALMVAIILFFGLLLAHVLTSDTRPDDPVNYTKVDIDLEWFAAFPTLIGSYGYNHGFLT